MDELKPCPFCGERPKVCDDNSYGDFLIACNCEAEPCIVKAIGSEAEAIAAWNQRSQDNAG